MQQDDLVVNCQYRLGTIAVSQSPSCVVRVYVPPFEEWENRSGSTFGFRLALQTHAWKVPEKKSGGFFFSRNRPEYTDEVYWPGIFIQFRSETDARYKEDSAFFTIRGNVRGADFKGPEVTETGWWTLGMSCTPDGQVHYYISQGVDDLTQADHVTSQLPYNYRAERFRTLFFNVCNRDDGSSWSTPWIIDDPSVYIASGGAVAGKQRSTR